MSISFSGLASGLDTSSWVESLVALKQAKIDTLEEEKETVLLSQETLNNIKSFFASFRSMIEKVTDAKFGVASMDLFAQNLATSSKLDVLTASATSEADEATYNVLVDKLASNTQVNSNYTYLTTIIQTTTATNDSKLINLGVNAGKIGVNVGGIEHQISITENDTIATFIEKLNKVGVEANYNEKTGIFSMNLDNDAINDIDNTGIVSALHLEGVNKGYTSDGLQTSQTETVYTPATEATLMKDLGVNAGEIVIHANDQDYTIQITEDSTFGTFLADLQANNIDAVLDKDGIFSITDAVITDEGTTNILDALGLEVDIYGKTQTTDELTYQTITTEVTTATSDTLLKDIGDGIAITDGQTVIVKDASNKTTTITVSETTTLGDLISSMNSAGLNASLTSSGRIEITEGSITGGTFDAVTALGLKQITSSMGVTGDVLYTGTEAFADESTKFSDLGITGNKTFTINDKNGSAIGTFTVSESDTIGDFLNTLRSNDITATISNGVIELESVLGNYVVGELADVLGISANTTEIVDTTQSSTVAITYTGTVVATGSTTMGDLGISLVDESKRVVNQTSFTSGETYYLTTSEDLVKLQDLVNSGVDTTNVTFELMNDIDMSGISFRGIGKNSAHYFKGTFDGNNHVISNLTINTTEDNVGLFGYTLGARIDSVGLENVNITGGDYVGGLAGQATGSSSITNSYATGSVTGSENVGGLVGYANSIITNSYANSSVNGEGTVGGLVGSAYGSGIGNSYATGSVTGNDCVGGLVGYVYVGSITNSYANGSVTATGSNAYVGGLVGYVTSGNNTINGYFDTQTTGQTAGIGSINSSTTVTGTVTGVTTEELNNLISNGTLPDYSDGLDWVNEAMRVVNQSSFVAGETYYLTTYEDLVKLQDLVNIGVDTTGVTFELLEDIDMSGVVFRGIGTGGTDGTDSSKYFKGTFNGDNHVISNLTINTTEDYVGLFGYTSGATIDSVGLENVNVTGGSSVGGLVGLSYYSDIINSYATGSVTGDSNVGGLVGWAFGGSSSSTNSNAAGSVTGDLAVGGIVVW